MFLTYFHAVARVFAMIFLASDVACPPSLNPRPLPPVNSTGNYKNVWRIIVFKSLRKTFCARMNTTIIKYDLSYKTLIIFVVNIQTFNKIAYVFRQNNYGQKFSISTSYFLNKLKLTLSYFRRTKMSRWGVWTSNRILRSGGFISISSVYISAQKNSNGKNVFKTPVCYTFY